MKLPTTNSLVNGIPLVIPTQTKQPTARLLLRNAQGMVVQQWLVKQNKCTLGSAASCSLRCQLPGIAPYHALLVIGVRQIFIRALAPKLTRDGQPFNELLLTDEGSHFELAGNRFELTRSQVDSVVPTQPQPQSEKPSAERIKFTLARPFELRNRPQASQLAYAVEPDVSPQPEVESGPNSDSKWVAQLIQAAMQPLECQIHNLIDPIGELQREARKQRHVRRKRLARKRKSPTLQTALSNNGAIASDSALQPASPQFAAQVEEIAAKHAAAMEVLTERITDVNEQLAAIERIVAEERRQSETRDIPASSLEAPENPQIAIQSAAIEQLQHGIVTVTAALESLQSQRSEELHSDQQWRNNLQSQIDNLSQVIDGLSTSVAEVHQLAVSVASRPAPLVVPLQVESNSTLSNESRSTFAPIAEAIEPNTNGSAQVSGFTEAEAPSLASPVIEPWPTPSEAWAENRFHDELPTEFGAADSNDPLPVCDNTDDAWPHHSTRSEYNLLPDSGFNPLPEEQGWATDASSQVVDDEFSQLVASPYPMPVEPDDYLPSPAQEWDFAESDNYTDHPFNADSSLGSEQAGESAAEAALWQSELDVDTPVESAASTSSTPPALPIAELTFADLPIAEVPIAEVPIAEVPIAELPIAEVPVARAAIDELSGTASSMVGKATEDPEMQVAPPIQEPKQMASALPSWWVDDEPDQEAIATDDSVLPLADLDSQAGVQEAVVDEAVVDEVAFLDTDNDSPTAVDAAVTNDEPSEEFFGLAQLGLEDHLRVAEPLPEAKPALVTEDFVEESPLDLDGGDELIGFGEAFGGPDAKVPAKVTLEPSDLMEPEAFLEAESQLVKPEHPHGLNSVVATLESDVGDEQDDSVEEYMRKLLARMRGVPEDQVELPKAAMPATPARSTVERSGAPTEVHAAGQASAPKSVPATARYNSTTQNVSQDVTEPFDPEKYMPRALAPERTKSLAAMRELANSSARTAIHKSTRQRHVSSILLKAIIAFVGFAVGMVLLAINGLNLNIGLIATVASFLVAAIWGYDSLSSIRPMLQNGLVLKPQVTGPSKPATPDEPVNN